MLSYLKDLLESSLNGYRAHETDHASTTMFLQSEIALIEKLLASLATALDQGTDKQDP
jgi:hypothetical protein